MCDYLAHNTNQKFKTLKHQNLLFYFNMQCYIIIKKLFICERCDQHRKRINNCLLTPLQPQNFIINYDKNHLSVVGRYFKMKPRNKLSVKFT